MHVRDDMELSWVLPRKLEFEELLRYDADHFATMCKGVLRDGVHQTRGHRRTTRVPDCARLRPSAAAARWYTSRTWLLEPQ